MKKLITICAVIVLFGTGYAWAGTWTTIPDIPGQAWMTPEEVSGGTVVGSWCDSLSYHGFVYDGGSLSSFDYPGYSPPGWSTCFYGVQGNTVVGAHGITGWTYDGLMYNISTQTWTNIVSPFPGFPDLGLFGIDGDKLVGNVWDGIQGYGQMRAVLYDGASWSIIQPPGSPQAGAKDISGNTVVGCYNDGNWKLHGFIYDGTNYTTVDWPGAISTDLEGISGSSMVGICVDASGLAHGLLYDGTAWTTLDMPGATSTQFFGIDGSTVVGNYQDASGMHGLIYTIPEPATLLLLGFGGLALLRNRKK
ncbi:MAG: PEP-CTERM sorting domain-containing protein [Sedimentisphaerales bacterium]